MKIITLLPVIAFLLISCKEDQIKTYSEPDAVNLYLQGRMADISFLLHDDLVSYTFELETRLVGYASSAERAIDIKVASLNRIVTNFQGEETVIGMDPNDGVIEMPRSVTLAAGESTAPFGITVYREKMESLGVYELVVEVVENVDFNVSYHPSVTLSFTNDFPREWYVSNNDFYAGYWMGICTRARYAYAYEYFGTIDLAAWSGMTGITPHISEMNRRIMEYNSQFGNDETKWLKDPDIEGGNLYMGLTSPF